MTRVAVMLEVLEDRATLHCETRRQLVERLPGDEGLTDFLEATLRREPARGLSLSRLARWRIRDAARGAVFADEVEQSLAVIRQPGLAHAVDGKKLVLCSRPVCGHFEIGRAHV